MAGDRLIPIFFDSLYVGDFCIHQNYKDKLLLVQELIS